MEAQTDVTLPVSVEPASSDAPEGRANTHAELMAYLDQVRSHRAELRESVRAVDDALESPIARGGAWRERVRAALAELAHDFQDHVELTESPGGLYERLRRASPRLSTTVNRLIGEHRDFGEAIGGYLAVLEHGGTMADLPAFREELTTLMGRLVRHRQRGSDLIYEAYEVDLGGSG
jgi:tryptophan 2,3-dioxygenase